MESCGYAALIGLVLVATAAALGKEEPTGTPGVSQFTHRPLAKGAIAVKEPTCCDKPGATYMLMNDITSKTTALFLAKDVTLDLNGYTITYVAGPYEHLRNGGFEEGFKGWDTSNAPGAKVVDVGGDWAFTGKKSCRMSPGDELVSSYVKLPVANRSYYAICGVLTDYAEMTVSVEDADGRPVTHEFSVGDKKYHTCPVKDKTIMDGGLVYAHFRGKPAGEYRVRIKAHDKAVIDGVDIRPAFDVGVGIVGKTWVYTDYRMVVVDKHMPCFVDYVVEGTADKAVDSIPSASGNTEITIRNGTIRSGFEGFGTWGVQAVGAGGVVNLKNVRIVSAGLNANAVYVPHARITNCRFETDTPFVLERHNLNYIPVTIKDSKASEVSYCQFVGGQGNLSVRGKDALVHHNLFVDQQRVVNHYALTLGEATGAKVYDNRFEPEIGCGINVYVSKDCEIYNNTFLVKACNANCAFYDGAGTIVGVRVSDYAAKPLAPRGAWGNRVHHNKFLVVGQQYRTFEHPRGRACAIFSSTGAGKNFIYDNDITIDHKDPKSGAMAVAFYIGASPDAGEYANNRITSNVTPVYLAVKYGKAGQAILRDNTFIKAAGAADYAPFAMGYWDATDIEFRSNKFEGLKFGITFGETHPEWKQHTYSVYWTLKVNVADAAGKPVEGAEVVILDKDGNEAARGKTLSDGSLSAELLEYKATVRKAGGGFDVAKESASPYTVKVQSAQQTVELTGNTDITMRVER